MKLILMFELGRRDRMGRGLTIHKPVSGHRYFRNYLHKMGKMGIPNCMYCRMPPITQNIPSLLEAGGTLKEGP